MDPDEQRKLIADCKKTGSHTAVTEQVQTKRTEQGVSQSKKPVNGIELQASTKKKAIKADIAASLRAWSDDLDNDGRTRTKAA